MPLAKAVSRSEVEGRSDETLVDAELIEKLVKKAHIIAGKAGVIDGVETARLVYNLDCTITAYRARVLADQQERPARIVTTLKPVLRSARNLLVRLNALPDGLRLELQAGGFEEQLEAIISKADDRLAYWRQHVAAHRPAGKGAASLDLRKSLTDIVTAHCPDVPEWRQRRWIAFACREIDARFPHEKKHRGRFTGEHQQKKRHSREELMAYIAGVIEKQLRNHEAMRAVQKKFSHLQGVSI